MKSQKVLLFCIDRRGQVGSALQSVLEPHFNVHVQLESTRATDDKSVRLIQPLEQRIHQWNPNLVFLVLSKDQLAESKELLESVQSFRIPVIVVTEACDSEGMFELLKGGAGDFIMPPIDASNVLPRAWRLLETKSTKPETTDCAERDARLKQLIGNSSV